MEMEKISNGSKELSSKGLYMIDTLIKAITLTQNVVNEQDIAVSQTKEIFSEILKSIEFMIKKVDEIKISISDMDKKKKSTMSKIENISFILEQTASAS